MFGRVLKVCAVFFAMTFVPAGAQAGYSSLSPVATDDHRYIAYLPADGTPLVVDTFKGRSIGIRNAEGCAPTDIRAGRVLLSCHTRTSSNGHFDFYTHRLARVDTGRSAGLGSERPAILTVLGRYWATGGYDSCGVSPHCTGDIFLNLKSGRVRFFGDGPRPDTRIADQKKLSSRLDLPDFPIGSQVVVDWDSSNMVTDDGRALTLWKPGKEPARIGKAIGYCCEIPSFRPTRFGSGQFVWDVRGNRFRSVRVSDLKSRTISLSGPGEVTPIRGGVLISRSINGAGDSGATYSIRVKRFR
ncbi:MAG: hypothetical protein M3Y23_06360 [Actinomycetota bacterium]|nr:hypothetical protein [Actinomycetota bacterium]